MKFVYISRMGKTESLIHHLGIEAIKIETGSEIINEPFILFTYTDGHGIVPTAVDSFLELNKKNLKGVIATGNMARHADTFCYAGDIISSKYNVPCLAKVDGEGTQEDWNSILLKL